MSYYSRNSALLDDLDDLFSAELASIDNLLDAQQSKEKKAEERQIKETEELKVFRSVADGAGEHAYRRVGGVRDLRRGLLRPHRSVGSDRRIALLRLGAVLPQHPIKHFRQSGGAQIRAVLAAERRPARLLQLRHRLSARQHQRSHEVRGDPVREADRGRRGHRQPHGSAGVRAGPGHVTILLRRRRGIQL